MNLSNLRVLSLDASTNKTGWCIMENGKYIESGIIDLHTDKDGEHRLCSMMKEIGVLIKKKAPDKVVLEETTMSANARTLRILAQLGGWVKGYCYVKGIPLEMIYPSSWRSLVGIKEGSKVKRENLKEQAIETCKMQIGIELPEDIAEASLINLAIAVRDGYTKLI